MTVLDALLRGRAYLSLDCATGVLVVGCDGESIVEVSLRDPARLLELTSSPVERLLALRRAPMLSASDAEHLAMALELLALPA